MENNVINSYYNISIDLFANPVNQGQEFMRIENVRLVVRETNLK